MEGGLTPRGGPTSTSTLVQRRSSRARYPSRLFVARRRACTARPRRLAPLVMSARVTGLVPAPGHTPTSGAAAIGWRVHEVATAMLGLRSAPDLRSNCAGRSCTGRTGTAVTGSPLLRSQSARPCRSGHIRRVASLPRRFAEPSPWVGSRPIKGGARDPARQQAPSRLGKSIPPSRNRVRRTFARARRTDVASLAIPRLHHPVPANGSPVPRNGNAIPHNSNPIPVCCPPRPARARWDGSKWDALASPPQPDHDPQPNINPLTLQRFCTPPPPIHHRTEPRTADAPPPVRRERRRVREEKSAQPADLSRHGAVCGGGRRWRAFGRLLGGWGRGGALSGQYDVPSPLSEGAHSLQARCAVMVVASLAAR